MFLFFIVSLLAVFYPFISNIMFEHRQDDLLEVYKQETEQKDFGELLQKAQEYNQELATGKIQLQDPFSEEYNSIDEDRYQSILRLDGTDMMAFIEIPVISVRLPVYHGTSQQILEQGVGHLKGSSFPIGGASTHAVLTSHTGLSNARLFTDLDRLKEGDLFFITVCDRKLAYQVDQIKVVEPEDTSDLVIKAGEDLCTLVTCTPYGINSHRLLVRGKRTEYVENMENEIKPLDSGQTQWMEQYRHSIVIGLLIMVGILLIYWILDKAARQRRKKKRARLQEKENEEKNG